MISEQITTYQHKVGHVHYFGTILADALKYDESGRTVTLYATTDKSGYNIVEWDKSGEFEITKTNTKCPDTARQIFAHWALNL